MIKLYDKKLYSEDINEMIKQYEKTMKEFKPSRREEKRAIEAAENTIELIDNLINAAVHCPYEETKSYLFLSLSLLCAMLNDKAHEYVTSRMEQDEDDLNETLDKLIDALKELKELSSSDEDEE